MPAQYSDFAGISRKAPPLRPKHDPGTPAVRGPSHRGSINTNRLEATGGRKIQGASIIDREIRGRRTRGIR